MAHVPTSLWEKAPSCVSSDYLEISESLGALDLSAGIGLSLVISVPIVDNPNTDPNDKFSWPGFLILRYFVCETYISEGL